MIQKCKKITLNIGLWHLWHVVIELGIAIVELAGTSQTGLHAERVRIATVIRRRTTVRVEPANFIIDEFRRNREYCTKVVIFEVLLIGFFFCKPIQWPYI